MRVCGFFRDSFTGVSVTAIYHLTVQIIGRSSGRSAVGSSAYRSGEKLHSIAHAAYQAGQKIYAEGDQITHDYTRKKGVIHNEIILPDNAPEEYKDRQALWNFVEKRSKRVDAQFAREIEVALQKEFELQENIELLREYIKENFVAKGMIADFALHDKGKGNPHAHIMLTLRDVTPDGFGNINRDWSKTAELVSWRENWAKINNRKFEEKGLEERIDHRTLKAQGIDRDPTIHLGAYATALEKKGIRSKRGDRNREIKQRNEERAAEKAQHKQELTESAENAKNEFIATNENSVDNERTIEKTAEHLNKLKEYYIAREKELSDLIPERNKIREELPRLNFRAESIDEHAKNIDVLQNKVAELQETRQNLNFLQWIKKQEADEAIKQAQQDVRRAEIFFKNRFYVDPSQAPEEIKRIQEKVRKKESDLSAKNAAILDIMEKQDKILLGYHTQKLLAETQHDKNHLDKLLEQLNKPPENIRDRLLQERIDRRLNIIPDESFQKVIEKLPQEHAQTLINTRKRTKEAEQEREKTKDRTRTIERSR
ncbi:MAG: MobA/MobL family protein [Candidatus Bathyarchaeota archaeon]|nr:MobA/MobL family protein [Candidatus Termiticorpusculum sp.]